MTRLDRAIRLVAALAAVTFAACSGHSPVTPSVPTESVAPSATSGSAEVVSPLAQAVAGSYELSFFTSGPNGLQPVTSLPVSSEELILGAHIENSSGVPAQRGSVSFQYCSFKERPPSDIIRADEAPSAAGKRYREMACPRRRISPG